MLCCVGLIGGVAVGQALGGPWTLIAPAAGFGIGLLADMKLMKRMHHGAAPGAEANSQRPEPAAAAATPETREAPKIDSAVPGA